MRGGVDNRLVIAQKIAAGGYAFAGRHHFQVGPVGGIHDVNLIALVAVAVD